MADDAPTSEEMKRLEEKIATLEKQKQLLEKERGVIEASRLLENAKAGPSATSRETAKLTEDLALLAEKQKAINALTPQLPQGLPGSITLDDSQLLEAQIVTYQTLSSIAGEIAKEVEKAGTGGAIVLVTQDDLNALAAVQMFETERELLRLDLERHAPEIAKLSLPAALLAIGPLVKTAADVMALFRTDTEFKAKSIVVADEAFIASVAGHLEGVRYYPAVFPSNALDLQALINAMKPLEQEFTAAMARHQKQTAGEPADESEGRDSQ
ncbi:MAG: hypothetical protein LC732_09870 [Acidobacteria bacterium]|nr:hypothetical protein [Acidobacteriota bacterium]